MMKKIFNLVCIIGLTINILSAQSDVRFEKFMRPYQPLTDSTSLNDGEIWDDPDYEVFSSLRNDFFNSDTTVYLYGVGSGGVLFLYTVANEFKLMAPTSFDLIDRGYADFDESLSELSWKVQGEDGERELIFEWKNAGFFNEIDLDEGLESFVNYQIRIFEREPVIEFHYGPSFVKYDFSFYSEIEDLFMACGVGKSDEERDILQTWLLNGNPDNPELRYLEFTDIPEDDSFVGLTSWPVENTVYRFYVPSANTNNIWKNIPSLKIQPTIASNMIEIILNEGSEFNHLSYIIKNSEGRDIKKGSSQSVPVGDLSSGLYYLIVFTDAKMPVVKKFIKQ